MAEDGKSGRDGGAGRDGGGKRYDRPRSGPGGSSGRPRSEHSGERGSGYRGERPGESRSGYRGERSGERGTGYRGERSGERGTGYRGERSGERGTGYRGERSGERGTGYRGERSGERGTGYRGDRSAERGSGYRGERTGESRPGHRGERSGERGGAKWSGPDRPRREQPAQRDREAQTRPADAERRPARDELPIPEGIEPNQLAPEVRRELSTLDKATADAVACHLVAAGSLLDDDPQSALRHARAARGRSGRITAIREAVGIAAYHCGDWTQALAELRAARRMGSKSALLPLIADCERGLGRPQRAIELAGSREAAELQGDEADELRMVAAGARADLGQLEQALTVLAAAQLDPERTGGTAARLAYAQAETLLALGRGDEALQWFLRAAEADIDGITDAEDRVSALTDLRALADQHDCLLLDLDGTVFCGEEPTTGAVEALAELEIRAFFITNNSSRGAAEVAAHLNQLGFAATDEDVATSAQVAAGLLAGQLAPGARVLVVGTEALAAEVSAAGLQPVRQFSEEPAAVIQGLSKETGWAQLAEAALAIRAGALWMTTNVDRTLPSERGLLPGNGSLVAALRVATDAEPQIAGKPSPALLAGALSRGEFYTPLVVGDRLDTDIAAANAAGLPSLMVLTGVNSAVDAVDAPPALRPTYLGHDLRALHDDADRLAIGRQPGWRIDASGDTLTVHSARPDDGDGLSVVRAVAEAVWSADFGDRPYLIEAGDDTARQALQRWSLLRPAP